MQTVTITLTVAGTDTGPFDLYSDADGYTTPFESGIAKASLVLGYTSVLVPDAATIIRVQSDSACTNFVDLNIVTTTTTTTSTTTSTTTTSTSTTTTTTTTQPFITMEMSLSEAVTGTPNWRAIWNTGGSSSQQDCVGSETQGPSPKALITSTVTCSVSRPTGDALDLWEITWKINGSNAPNPDGFAIANPTSGGVGPVGVITYTFVGINAGDALSVEITEG